MSMYRKIDLSDWTCFSNRFNSKSYVSSDRKWMVKFASDAKCNDENLLEREREKAFKALSIGVKTPKVGDIVVDDEGRKGLIYEYIDGKKSISRLMCEDLNNIDYYMKKFAECARDFHSTVCDATIFESFAGRIREQIVDRDILFDAQKVKALKLLDTVEEKNFCVHGDFQTGNFILVGDKYFIIDLNCLGYGNPELDVAIFYHFCHYVPPEIINDVFHCEPKYTPIMWDSFVRHYYDTNDEKAINEINDRMRKLACISMLGFFKFIDVELSIYKSIRKRIDDIL